jgi:hypothetical protein
VLPANDKGCRWHKGPRERGLLLLQMGQFAKPGRTREMMEPTLGSIAGRHLWEPLATREVSDEFARFSRYRRLLHFIACRVLGNAEDAELAIQNSWLIASRSRSAPDGESAFRSWLVRVLINEALAIVRHSVRS